MDESPDALPDPDPGDDAVPDTEQPTRRSPSEISHQARNELYAIILRARNARDDIDEFDDRRTGELKHQLTDIEARARAVDTLIAELTALAGASARSRR